MRSQNDSSLYDHAELVNLRFVKRREIKKYEGKISYSRVQCNGIAGGLPMEEEL
jgi:hypothetical protein